MVESAPIESTLDSDPEFEYQSVERWAIVSLLFGFASPLALIAPLMWIIPIFGWLTGGVALARIRREPGRPGRGLVLAGLALSTFFICVPVARMTSVRVMLVGQPRPMADQFIKFLQEGRPEKAVTLNWVPDYRLGVSDNLWLFFRSDAEAKSELTKFVRKPEIRMLLALGEDADVRHYKTTRLGVSGAWAQVEYIYSVTFVDDDDQKKTYFIGLLMERKPTKEPGLNPWRVRKVGGGLNPL